MQKQAIIDVVIPAYNEEGTISLVVSTIPAEWVRFIVVCDNNSTDKTATVAKLAGAKVVFATQKGYGHACLEGINFLKKQEKKPDILVFIDGDFSDFPEQLPALVRPIIENEQDLVIGSRVLGQQESGAMTIPQRFGNWLSTRLIRWLYGYRFTDLGPFRAVRFERLLAMNMQDKTYGWTVEMQVKAAKMKLKCTEIAVDYRKRAAGKSKVSGTIRGTFLAGYKILWTIFKLL